MTKITDVQVPLHKLPYSEFINKALGCGWRIISCLEGLQTNEDEKVLMVGHRVPDKIQKARDMARLEFDKGVHCSYFILTLAPEMISEGLYVMNYLWQLNHEVNFMIDCIEGMVKYNENVHTHIIGNLQLLTKFGINSRGIAMYDDSEVAIQSGFKGVNYFYNFSEKEGYISINNSSIIGNDQLINFGVHSLAEYGLVYEESEIKYSHLLSDNKGQIMIDAEVISRKKAKDAIFKFLEEESGKTKVSFCPMYWNI